MKLFSKMLSKKPEQEQPMREMDLDMDVEPLRRRDAATNDDTGSRNASLSGKDGDRFDLTAPLAEAPDPAPDPAPEAEDDWNEEDWDDDWDDEDWGDDDTPATAEASGDKAQLVDEIREAMDAVQGAAPTAAAPDEPASRPVSQGSARSWAVEGDVSRRERARSQLGQVGESSEDRILEKTNSAMGERETSRRRSAMAHLKAAAQATKADRVLQHVAERDPSADPEEQSPYRDDLAKVVRPHVTSRPITRPVSRPVTETAIWDQGQADEDAAAFAAASDGAAQDFEDEVEAEEERLARIPPDLSEDEFADDAQWDLDDEDGAEAENAFAAADPEPHDPEPAAAEADADGPVPSRVVSEAVQMANAPDVPHIDDGEVRRKIWEASASEPAVEAPAAEGEESIVNVAAAVTGRAGRGVGRVKTRLLGFQAGDLAPKDVFAQPENEAEAAGTGAAAFFPAGWIVVVDGPGRGACFTLHSGVAQIGRGEDQPVRLDFGDTSISRNNHAAVAYDDEQGKFFLGHGGKSNLVRLNGRPVLSTEEMESGDEIRIGETTLRFIALCGDDFVWNRNEGDDAVDAADA